MLRLSYPLSVHLEITERCTQRCTHCYNYWRFDDVTGDGELDVEDFLSILRQLNKAGVDSITITGGEPLLRRDVLFAVVQAAKGYDMEVGLNTNASLMTLEDAKRLAEMRLDHAMVSILGSKSSHDTVANVRNGFDQTHRGSQNLHEAGIPLSVNMVVSKINQSEVFDVAQIAYELGARTFSATPIIPSHSSNTQYMLSGDECKNTFRALLQAHEKFGITVDCLEPIPRCLYSEEEDEEFLYFLGRRLCTAGISSCVISAHGDVRPCPHSDVIFGNMLTEGLDTIWERMAEWTLPSMLPDECQECHANIICEGGCRMSAKMVSGDYNGKDWYMRGSITEPIRAGIHPSRRLPSIEIDENTPMQLNPRCRLRREEKFGGVVYVGGHIEFLSLRGFELIKSLNQKSTFCLLDAAKELQCEPELVKRAFSRLLSREIVTKRD